MIIVSGKIYVSPGQRATFLEHSRQSILEARMADGCRDFVVAADPIEPDRVNVYEEWDSETKLESFRGSGPGSDLSKFILRTDIAQHAIRIRRA